MKKKTTKETNEKSLKDIINTPKAIIIFLIIILLVLFISIIRLKNSYKFYSGQVSYNDMAVAEIHYYSEPTMTYFFANNAVYGGEDKDIYGIDLKYVVYVYDKEVVIDESKYQFDEKRSLASSIMMYSKFKTVDLKGKTNPIFTDEVKKNINTLKLIVKANTIKDKDYDINLEYNVTLSKLK